MITLLLLLFVSASRSQSLFAGDSCSFANGAVGVCTELADCELVKQQLRIGKRPEKLCGYSGLEAIVCCSSPELSSSKADERGAISREKCTEYSKHVFVLKEPPLLISREKVNISQCAIGTNLLIWDQPTANRKEFPYMAAVGFDLKTSEIGWYCNGALISETFVLTAAHCTFLREFGEATWVRLGDLDLVRTDDGAEPEDRRIIERIKHPQYKLPSVNHDIALLRLQSRVPFNSWIRPACVHTAPSTGTEKAMATGWEGSHSVDNEHWSELKKTKLTIVNSKTCTTRWASGEMNYKLSGRLVPDDLTIICAGGTDARICQEAEGQPLVIRSENYCMYDVVGVASIGNNCRNHVPAIFTRVYNYLSWIEAVVWGKT